MYKNLVFVLQNVKAAYLDFTSFHADKNKLILKTLVKIYFKLRHEYTYVVRGIQILCLIMFI